MACKNNADNRDMPTLRDVALAALELDASGGHGPVSWKDVVEKTNAVVTARANKRMGLSI